MSNLSDDTGHITRGLSLTTAEGLRFEGGVLVGAPSPGQPKVLAGEGLFGSHWQEPDGRVMTRIGIHREAVHQLVIDLGRRLLDVLVADPPERALATAWLADPTGDARHVYADWLEEKGRLEQAWRVRGDCAGME